MEASLCLTYQICKKSLFCRFKLRSLLKDGAQLTIAASVNVWECVCLCASETVTQILLLLPLPYITPPTPPFQEVLCWRSRKNNTSPQTPQLSFTLSLVLVLFILFIFLCDIRLLIQDFQIHFLAICGSHFPKYASVNFSHIQPEVCITVEDVIAKRLSALLKCCRKQKDKQWWS